MSKTHIVKRGESLSKIAEKYNTTVSAIQKANAKLIKNVNNISVGWVLTIPTPTSKDHTAIGQKVEEVVRDIESLQSFKELEELLG